MDEDVSFKSNRIWFAYYGLPSNALWWSEVILPYQYSNSGIHLVAWWKAGSCQRSLCLLMCMRTRCSYVVSLKTEGSYEIQICGPLKRNNMYHLFEILEGNYELPMIAKMSYVFMWTRSMEHIRVFNACQIASS